MSENATEPKWFTSALNEPCDSIFINVAQDVDCHCLRWGASSTKRALVFIHGGGAHCQWFKFIAPFFASEFDVLAISNTGNGDSSNQPTHYTMNAWSEEIITCCTKLGYFSSQRPRPFLVAHSLGTYIVTNMLVNFPAFSADNFAGLVLCDGAIRSFEMAKAIQEHITEVRRNDPATKPRESWIINPSTSSPLERFKLRPVQECANTYILKFISESNISRNPKDGSWTWKGDFNREAKVDWDNFPILCDRDVSKIAQSGVRVVWMYGENSVLCDSSVAEHVNKVLGHEIGIVCVPGAAHHVWLDEPLAFVSGLRGIFAGWSSSNTQQQRQGSHL